MEAPREKKKKAFFSFSQNVIDVFCQLLYFLEFRIAHVAILLNNSDELNFRPLSIEILVEILCKLIYF